MKNSKKKNSDNILLAGLAMMITGAGGIGYIPGKPMLLTVLFVLVLAVGIILTASYARRKKSIRRLAHDRSKRIPEVAGEGKSYSQSAA